MKFKFFVLALAVLLVSSGLMFGQTVRGRIEGTVKDPQGQVVPNASITITNTGTGEKLNATSSNEGAFSINEVKPGTYTVGAEVQGFKKILIEGITVQVGTVTSITVQLELGTVNEQVNIAADDAQVTINTSNAEIGEVVDRQKILELPLDGRNPFELTALQAGVQTKTGADGEISRFSINGNRTVANNLTVDGVNASDNFLKTPANITLPVIPVSVESIAEFRVTTSLPAAEFGRGSAQINAVTASGTNKFRGSIFEFHRNTAFNANNFFNNSTILENGQSVPREPLIRNQFGGRLGGPIIKDRAFFFFSYEGKRESRGLSRNRLVYTSQARQGIFRYIKGLPTNPANVAAATITAPAGTATTQSGTCAATAGGTPPRVVIPTGAICVQNILAINANRTTIDPTTSAFLALTQLPNNFKIGDGLNTGGFRFNAKVISPTDQFSTRIDFRLSDKHTFEATYNYGKILFNGDYINEREPAFPGSDFGTRQTIGRGMTGTFRSIITPSIINEARVGAQISGLTFGNTADYSRGYLFDLSTVFSPEYNNVGTGRSLRVLQFTDNLTVLRGNHTFKMGAEVRNLWVNRYSLTGTLPVVDFDNGVNDPGFSQTQQFAGLSPTTITPVETLANILTGAIGNVTQVFNVVNPNDTTATRGAPEVREYSNWETNFYLQDSWRMRPNLTVNLGLRYEYNTTPREANNLGLLPVGGSAGLYGVSGDGNLFMPGVLTGTAPVLDYAPNGEFFKADKNNFAPVIGVAWDPFKNGKFSIRGGYRISYFQGSFNIIDGTLDDNEGLILTTTRTVNNFLRNGIGETPVPTVTIPAPQNLQAPFANSAIDIRAFDENLKTPYVHDYTFGVQYEIFKGTSLEVRYVGNRGKKLYRGADVNQVNIFARDTVTGMTFLDAFKIGQNNLKVCAAVSCTTGFRYNAAVAGSVQNPLMDVLFTGQTSSYTLSALVDRVAQGRAGDFVDYILRLRTLNNVRGGAFLSAVAAGRLPLNFLRANPAVRGAQLFANGSTSAYDSMQIELTRRLSGGLRFQASYTFAKGLSDFTGSSGDTNSFLTLLDKGREYAQYTNTHQFLANVIYQLPFGKGRKYLTKSNSIVNHIIGGWQISVIGKYTSGDPLSLLSGLPSSTSGLGTVNRDGLSGSNTIDVVGGLTRGDLANLVGIRSNANGVFYIDPNLAPGSTTDASKVIFLNPQAGTVGALGLSSITGPRFLNFDLNFLKRIRIKENMNIEFRAEMFNVFNTVNFANPETDINETNFGRIDGIVGRPRLMQFALRLNF
jgi:Carboxypeptidase regulatory-like domain